MIPEAGMNRKKFSSFSCYNWIKVGSGVSCEFPC